MSKRRLPASYHVNKRFHVARGSGVLSRSSSLDASDVVFMVRSAIAQLCSLFPQESFQQQLPPLALKHQIYSLVSDRTLVDTQVSALRDSGELRMFKLSLGGQDDDYCIVFTEPFHSHVRKCAQDLSICTELIDNFISKVLSSYHDVSISKGVLMNEFEFTEEDIIQLVKVSVLTVRDVGSWWFSIPNAGRFVKPFVRGRKALITMIRKRKYHEILQSELEQRKLEKKAKLGIHYHMHDIIGADLVTRVLTTSGPLLRLKD